MRKDSFRKKEDDNQWKKESNEREGNAISIKQLGKAANEEENVEDKFAKKAKIKVF